MAMNYLGIDIDATSLRLKERIEESPISVKEIHEQLGVSIQAIYAWMSPKLLVLPSLDNAILLASLLNTTVEDLIIMRKK